MKSRLRSLAAGALLTTLGAWVAFAQAPGSGTLIPPPAASAPPRAAVPIATVGSRSVSRDEFRARETGTMSEYRGRLGQDVPEELKPALRRQLLENLIRRELLVLEAQRRGIVATDADADAQLRRDPFFNPNGHFDAQRYDAVRTGQAENYRRAIAELKLGIAARTLNDRLEEEFVGNDPAIRNRAMRNLTRAEVSVLALRRSDFRGGIREPRESEVIAWYRTHTEDFRRPARGKLTILQVDQPPLPDGVTIDSPEGIVWRNRMKARADSTLTAIHAGAKLEDLIEAVGSLRRQVDVTPDNFPGYWQGDDKDRAAVFASKPGSVLGTPVPGSPGWLIVRVDELHPVGLATMAEVARSIRGQLRTDARLHGEDLQLRALYGRMGDSLKTTGWKLRFAVFDTAQVNVPEPDAAELDRWYRAHQADFSRFDASAGRIAVRPLAEVRDEVRSRWRAEQRLVSTRLAATQVEQVWKKGQRDRAAEHVAAVLREVGPLVEGAPVDTGLAAGVLTDSLRSAGLSLRAGSVAWSRGRVVYQIYESVHGFVPPFEQVRPLLRERAEQQRVEEDERGARALYDKDPTSFARGMVIHYTRLLLDRPNPLSIHLSRADVEKYHREHLDKYSAPEMVSARHILINPRGTDEKASEAARQRVAALLERARQGEDFATLARENSDDVATREKGGDLGSFARGAMIQSFEDVAFRLKPGELSEPFRSEVGWDIIKCESHDPIHSEPLRYIYANVGWDAASEKAESLVVHRADSLVAAIHTPAQALAACKKMHITPDRTFFVAGTRTGSPELIAFEERLERTAPGSMVPGRGNDPSAGHFVAWVDSITAARAPDWGAASVEALDRYRRGAGQRALQAKAAELDSMMASGWSLDSLAILFGGLEKVKEAAPGSALASLGGSEISDSLLFGTRASEAALKDGKVSGWLDLPGGLARFRLERLAPPNPGLLAGQVQTERRLQLERRLHDYFEDLKKRYPVRILDSGLRDTPLPTPPPPRN